MTERRRQEKRPPKPFPAGKGYEFFWYKPLKNWQYRVKQAKT